MAEHLAHDVTVRPVQVSITHKLDPEQFSALLAAVTAWLAPFDESQLSALTEKLKQSSDALASVVAANHPQPFQET